MVKATLARATRAVLFDLGNTLVTYYATAEFPTVLQQCLQECRDVLGWSPDAERDHTMFVRAMRLNAERPDGAVHALDERLMALFGEYATIASGLMPRCFAEMLAGGSRTRPRFNVRWNRST